MNLIFSSDSEESLIANFTATLNGSLDSTLHTNLLFPEEVLDEISESSPIEILNMIILG